MGWMEQELETSHRGQQQGLRGILESLLGIQASGRWRGAGPELGSPEGMKVLQPWILTGWAQWEHWEQDL